MKRIIFIVSLFFPLIAFAATSVNYQLNQEGTGFTEFNASSANYQFDATIGEPGIETSSSANYIVDQGRVWAVTETSSPDDSGSSSSGSSGGGGGGGGGAAQIGVTFSGRAYPLSRVELLKDGQIVASILAGPDARFSVTVSGINVGSHNFSVIGIDKNGRRSKPLTFPITLTKGATTKISGLYLAPTLAVDKRIVKRGDNIAIFGQTVPTSEVTIGVASEHETFHIAAADDGGVFLLNFDTAPLEKGDHETRVKSAKDGEISDFGHPVGFAVGDRNVINPDEGCPQRGDLNDDCRVNLVDFSIAAFWYKQPLSDTFRISEAAKLNGDGQVTLVDFSIMAFYWTG